MHDLLSAEPKMVQLLQRILRTSKLDLTFDVQRDPGAVPAVTIEFKGPDTSLLTARDGELLRAMEHLGAKILHLEPEQHDLLSMNADRFKEERDKTLVAAARSAIDYVRETGNPFAFAPMSSHERRRLHLFLASSGMQSASIGEGPRRAVVLHPPRVQ